MINKSKAKRIERMLLVFCLLFVIYNFDYSLDANAKEDDFLKIEYTGISGDSSASGDGWTFVPQTESAPATLTLSKSLYLPSNGSVYTSDTFCALVYNGTEDLLIKYSGDISISGIKANGSITLEGVGDNPVLRVSSSTKASRYHAIETWGDITINGGTVYIKGKEYNKNNVSDITDFACGIKSYNGNIIINDSKVTVEGGRNSYYSSLDDYYHSSAISCEKGDIIINKGASCIV